MPHIIGKNIKDISYPITSNGYDFLFESSNDRTSLISCEFNNKKFFIRKQKKQNGTYIIKGEKITRPSPISILHNAIIIYSDISSLEIVKSNISNTVSKDEASSSKYIQDIEFLNNLIKKSKYKKYELEIGFGSGRHILDLASKNKDTLYIGLEIYKPSLDQVSNLIGINNLENIYLCSYDARAFIKNLEANTLDAIYVHFPVPWDKKPHRRIFSSDFILSCNKVLKNNAMLNLRSDSIKYYDFVVSLFEKMDLDIKIRKNEEIKVVSKYEDRWKKLKKDIYDIIYIKKNDICFENDISNFNFTKIDNNENKLMSTFNNKFIQKDYGFVKFRDMYLGASNIVISVIFGNKYFHESKYITINMNSDINNISYFPSLPTKYGLNFKFHNIIDKTIAGYFNG